MRAVTLSGFLVVLLLLGAGREASGISLRPAVDGSVRDGLDFPKDGIGDTVLDGAVVQVLNVDRLVAPFEDRGIIEFDITGGVPAQGRLKFVLPVFAAMGPFPFTIGVFGYAGDGVLSLADFAAGSFLTSFEYSGQPTVVLDVTEFVRDLVASGDGIAGFNLQFSIPTTIPLNGPFVAFGSLEFPPTAELTVAAPSTLALIAAGVALGIMQRLFRADPRAHRATHVAPDLIERTRHGGSETRSGIGPGGGVAEAGGQEWHASEHAGPAGQESREGPPAIYSAPAERQVGECATRLAM